MVEVTRPTLEASFSNQDDEENREDKIRLFVFKLSSNNHSVFSEKIRKDKKLNTYSTGKLDQDIHNRASISGRITSYSFQKISEYLCNLYK